MTLKLTTRGPAVAAAILDLKPFTTHGALRGLVRGDAGFWNTGQLSTAEFAVYHSTQDIDYVVMSYNTPIAWHSPTGWHKVDQKFSVTTSRHQGHLYLIESTR